jgi:hypothetical protein
MPRMSDSERPQGDGAQPGEARVEPPVAAAQGESGGARPASSPGAHANKTRPALWLKRAAAAVAAVILVAVVAAFFLPRHATVSRNVEIAAPPAAVYAIVSDLRRFNEWSPWFARDPNATYTFTGPVDGVGQTMNWESKNPQLGAGKIVISSLVPDSDVEWAIDFGRQAADSSIKLEQSGTGSKVTWAFSTDLGFNPLMRYFGLGFDKMVGPDYEAGLAKLKAVAEKPAASGGG